jgi:hypothetical protein
MVYGKHSVCREILSSAVHCIARIDAEHPAAVELCNVVPLLLELHAIRRKTADNDSTAYPSLSKLINFTLQEIKKQVCRCALLCYVMFCSPLIFSVVMNYQGALNFLSHSAVLEIVNAVSYPIFLSPSLRFASIAIYHVIQPKQIGLAEFSSTKSMGLIQSVLNFIARYSLRFESVEIVEFIGSVIVSRLECKSIASQRQGATLLQTLLLQVTSFNIHIISRDTELATILPPEECFRQAFAFANADSLIVNHLSRSRDVHVISTLLNAATLLEEKYRHTFTKNNRAFHYPKVNATPMQLDSSPNSLYEILISSTNSKTLCIAYPDPHQHTTLA